MENTDWLDWAGSGLAFGLLISSFLLIFITIWRNQRQKRQ